MSVASRVEDALPGSEGPATDRRTAVPNVAVVAVHGIGQQARGEAARAIAALLLRLQTADGASRFGSFRETPLQVPVHPLRVAPRRPNPDARRSRLQEHSDALAAQLAGEKDDEAYAAEYEFMRAQLEQYKSSCDPYDTIRLEGTRLAAAAPASNRDSTARPGAGATVHVYELFWADLSRVGEGMLRLFGAFYQLLFNLAHLGRLAIDHAGLTYRSRRGWRTYWGLHTWAVRLLTIFVPVSWLIMLATSLGLVVLALPGGAKALVVGIVSGVLVSTLLWAALRAAGTRGVMWWAVPSLGIATTYLVQRLASVQPALVIDRVFVVAWALLSFGLVLAVFRRYERLRPGAFGAGWITGGFVLAVTLAYVPLAQDADQLLGRTLDVFTVETFLTVVLWYVLYVSGFAATVVGFFVHRGLEAAERSLARRIHWTGMATLALSTSAVLVVTFTLWSATLTTTRPILRPLAADNLRLSLPWFQLDQVADADRIHHYLKLILESSAGAGYPLLLWCLLVAALIGLVALGPSMALELRAPAQPHGFTEHAAPPTDSPSGPAARESAHNADAATLLLGRSLDDALVLLGKTAALLFLFTFALQPAVSIVHWVQETTTFAEWLRRPLEWLHSNGARWIAWSGGLLGASGLGLLALRARLGPLVDTALDIDNYLREHPRDRTPRARIAERYASLLRYLNAWRDDDGRPYERVILVAHSQGTVISVDLLGFARCERDANPDLFPLLDDSTEGPDDRRLALFTMGSPLRQMYQTSFPTLFQWMDSTYSPWGTPKGCVTDANPVPSSGNREPQERIQDGHRVAGPPLREGHGPRAEPLGLWRWVNAYRSGDYVGRALWREESVHGDLVYRTAPLDTSRYPHDAADTIWVSEDAGGARRELCIGRGAHTHYWDATAMPIAVELDLLITTPTGPSTSQFR